MCLTAMMLTSCAANTAPNAPAPVVTAAAAAQAAEKTSGVGFYFNTVVTVTLYGAQEGLLQDIWTMCERYENLLSKTIAGSDVDRVNRAGGQPTQVDPETWDILRRAREISAMTGGAFSVTIAPISAMWDFTGGTNRMPADDERIAALPLVDDSKIHLSDNSTVTLPEGVQIDLGGIAKGYIADKAAELVSGKCSGAVLSFGGNVYVLGHKPDGSAFNVGIQDPDAPTGTSLAVVSTTDLSVVTSGVYERFFEKDGVRYHHILDPKTGLPAQSDLTGATIVDKSSMTADALATACIVLGSEKAAALLETNGFKGLLITGDRRIITTGKTEESFSLRMLVEDAALEAYNP